MHNKLTRLIAALIIVSGLLLGASESKADTPYLFAASLAAASSQDEGGIVSSKKIRIINLGPVVNTNYKDFAPTISADGKTLYFVSNRNGGQRLPGGEFSEDFWYATKDHRLDTVFHAPINLDTSTIYGRNGVNTEVNEGAASIASDKQTLYFTGCARPGGLGSCDIYRSTIIGNKWSKPINLGRNVNSKFWESNPSISPDNKRLYFISNKSEDGTSEVDDLNIWYSDWDDDLEEFKPAVPLKELNTGGNERSPFIAADGVTLFFASDGYKNTLGGLDFYYSRYDEGSKNWGAPFNLGEPINTPEDDYYITLPASGDIIYFSSKRKDLAGYQGDLDLYMAFVPTFFRAVSFKVEVYDECSGESIPANVVVKNQTTNRLFKDSVTSSRKEIEMIVANADFGNPKDSLPRVNLEVTASNPKYGEITRTAVVNRPSVTTNYEETKVYADEVRIRIPLGQKPSIKANIADAKFALENKEKFPELATYNGLIMRQKMTWNLYPLLNYVFFDLGESKIPERYVLFQNNAETKDFADTTIPGGTFEKYYHLLNIYAYRLIKNPSLKIEIVGCNDDVTDVEKRLGNGLSKARATNVYNYFKDVWQIEESRLKLSWRNRPEHPSNPKDSMGIVENRRVEIISNDWEITKPVFDINITTFPDPENMSFTLRNGIEDALIVKRRIEINREGKPWNTLTNIGLVDPSAPWDWKNLKKTYPQDVGAQALLKDLPEFTAKFIVTAGNGKECESDPITIPVKFARINDREIEKGKDSTDETYNLVLFPFDSPKAGPINERIMRDYVYDRCMPTSAIEVIGHTDVVGLYERNMKLSQDRATTVTTGINKTTGGTYGKLDSRGVGEDEPLYTNELPEGRFYNRTVQVKIKTPLKDLKK